MVDPEVAVGLTTDLADYLYKELQFALRRVAGTRTLDEVLGDKQGINAAMVGLLEPALARAGLQASSVGIKDIVLPGDVRELVNRVVEAEKSAQANVIKCREETAATRSLLNTARLMECGRQEINVYPTHSRTRKSLWDMIVNLSVTVSRHFVHSCGNRRRKKSKTASTKCPKLGWNLLWVTSRCMTARWR